MSTRPEQGWAVATGVNQRSGRRYLFLGTVARTRREAIERYEGGDPTYREDHKRHDVTAVRVLVQIADEPTPTASES